MICFYGKLDWQVLLDSFTKATAIIKHEEEVAREELRRLTHTSEEIHRSSNPNASEIVPYAQALLNPSHAKCIETYLNFAFYAFGVLIGNFPTKCDGPFHEYFCNETKCKTKIVDVVI